MTRGFEHQDRWTKSGLPRSAPSPQHGQKPTPAADRKEGRSAEPRSFQPRPGH